MRAPIRRTRAGGFTLAEAAITIAIVAIVITMVLQGLEGAKQSAAHTRYRKTAYELGTGLLGDVHSSGAEIYQAFVSGSLVHVVFHQGRHDHDHSHDGHHHHHG